MADQSQVHMEPDEVETASQRLASLNPTEDAYFVAFNEFANELMSRFDRSRDLNDLDTAISETQRVLASTPPSHFFHAPAQCLIGQALTKRFKLCGNTDDLARAVSHSEAAVAALTPEHYLYLPFVVNFANSLLSQYRTTGDAADLDRVIETCSPALSASSQSPVRDSLLNNLANALKERFVKQGDKLDLDAALAHYQSCLDLRPPGHPSRSSALGNLADAMLLKFEVDGCLQDLETAAIHHVSAMQLCSPGQDSYLFNLVGLGLVSWHLFIVEGNSERLEMAVGCYQTAMEYSKTPNLEHSRLLDNYSAALQSRYILLGNTDDLDQAIRYLTTSADILPPTSHGRPLTLVNLANALVYRFGATSNLTDLDSSIEKLSSALELCGPRHYQRPFILSVYGISLSARFRAKGDLQDLSLAISICKEALSLSSPNRPDYPSIMANLASILSDSFRQSGNMEECQTIIDHCDRALSSARPAEPVAISLKIIRAKVFLFRFEQQGDMHDINACIAALHQVLLAIPESHTEHVHVCLHIGAALALRCKLTEDLEEMEAAIAFLRTARRNCKSSQFLYASVSMQLGNTLRERYEYRPDDVDTLDEAIVLLAEAEDILSPHPGHVDYAASLNNLGAALYLRFQAQRNKVDLDAALERTSRALTLSCSAARFLPAFNHATLLHRRYAQDKNLGDLVRSGQLFGDAAERMPPQALERVLLCHNYASALYDLARHNGDVRALDTAIELFKEAIEHRAASPSYRPWMSMHLATAQFYRGTLLGDDQARREALDSVHRLIESLPNDSPALHSVCHGAANLAMDMGEQDPSFLEHGFRYYERAVRYTYNDSFMNLYVALDWVEHANNVHHASALAAYQAALDALHHHLLATASIKSRHAVLLDEHLVSRTTTLATDATACAITEGKLELAVELSERGRGLLWSQLAQSRTPLDALRSASDAGRALASEFERLNAQLAQNIVPRGESVDETLPVSFVATGQAARRYHQLSHELEDVVGRIRQQPGFESFLLRPPFEGLQRAAVDGPVILVNISDQRCDALIVLHDTAPRLVPLPDTSLDALTTLSTGFYRMLRTTGHVGEEKMREREVSVVLRTLWDTLVGPIVDALSHSPSSTPRGARIWWCPTSKLTTLPVHAAGPYRKGALNLANVYVSSYTPTLTALVRARRRREEYQKTKKDAGPPAFVAIGQAQPASAAGRPLEFISSELALVRSLLPPQVGDAQVTVLDADASTAEAALSALATHGWAHLACHGYPNVERPFDAAFAMRDGEVTVLDIVRARGEYQRDGDGDGDGDGDPGQRSTTDDHRQNETTPNAAVAGEFAFLSACHTAALSAAHTPDEIVHLAAAMQFSGYRSVVGTMWAVDDGMARDMVKAFYTCLFDDANANDEEDTRWDATRAARALNKAAKMVDKQKVTLDQRIVFMHIGV